MNNCYQHVRGLTVSVLFLLVAIFTLAEAQAGSITGTVTGPDGLTPLANIFVDSANVSTWDWGSSTYTDGSGHYELTGLAAGTYHVTFSDDGEVYAPEVYNNVAGSDLWNDGTDIVVTETGTNTGINASLAIGSKITGKVTGSDGLTPLANIYVECVNKSDSYWGPETYTDSSGNYELTGLAAGTYHVGFSDDDGTYAPEVYNNIPGDNVWNDGEDLVVPAASTISNINASLVTASWITGIVTGPDEVTGLPNIYVQTYRWNGSWWSLAGASYPDIDGYYEIGGLGAGTYRVTFIDWNGDYVSEVYDNIPGDRYYDSGANIVVGEGSVNSGINASLAIASWITGTVAGSDGITPLEDIDVQAYHRSGPEWVYTGYTTTDTDGTYAIGGLMEGSYRVNLHDWSGTYVPEVYSNMPGTDVWRYGTEISLPASVTVSNIDAFMDEYASLGGLVAQADGLTPIAGVLVQMLGLGRLDGWVFSARTDVTGAYFCSSVYPGDYAVRTVPAASIGYLGEWYDNKGLYVPGQETPPVGADVVTLTSGEDRTGINFALYPAGRVAGTVTGNGIPLAGCPVKAKNGTYGLVRNAATGDAGTYELMGLLPGSYTLKAEADEYKDEWWSDALHEDSAALIAVASGDDLSYDFDLMPGQSPALVDVRCDPEVNAVVYVDYWPTTNTTPAIVDIGNTVSRPADAGGWGIASHTVSIKKAGVPRSVPQIASAVEAETITMTFDVSSDDAGSVGVDTTPAGSQVYIDYADVADGVTPLVVDNLAPGTHTILLKQQGYLQSRPVMVQVGADLTNMIVVPLAPVSETNRIIAEVRSIPPHAEIYVDYLSGTNLTDAVIDWMDPASHAGAGWHSASHVILLRKDGYQSSSSYYPPEGTNDAGLLVVSLVGDTNVLVDLDHDGMPDQWEDSYDLTNGWEVQISDGDYDGDGVSNYGEMIAGTHPGNLNSVFEMSEFDLSSPGNNEEVTFIFSTVPGRRYIIQGKANLGNNSEWIYLSGIIIATDYETSYTASMAGMRFFRLLVWAP